MGSPSVPIREDPERQRRASTSQRLGGLQNYGGPNSLRNFGHSWQRAAEFLEVLPHRPSFVLAPDQDPIAPKDDDIDVNVSTDGGTSYGTRPATSSPRSLLRQQLLDSRGQDTHDEAVTDEESPLLRARDTPSDRRHQPPSFLSSEREAPSRRGSIFHAPPPLSLPLVGSFGSHVSGDVPGSRLRQHRSHDPPTDDYLLEEERGRHYKHGEARRHYSHGETLNEYIHREPTHATESELESEDDDADYDQPEDEAHGRRRILVKEVEREDGRIVLAVEGQSTLPQTIFNSINVLIGVGILSLPLGLKYAGWIWGMSLLLLAALVTAFTAKLLGRCMDEDATIITFSDIAFVAFGARARLATSILFTAELVAACVALVILFADTLATLFPEYGGVLRWKLVCAVLLVPLNFLPLRLLSVTSVVGIACCLTIFGILIADGLWKAEAPGSLRDPAPTRLFPEHWSTLPLAFGLMLSPWGGHSVFPNIYRDMRHPHRYGQALRVTFSFTCLLVACTAVAGFLMFGDDVLEEVSNNILLTDYPRASKFLLCFVTAIIPITKLPLTNRPIVSTVEHLVGLPAVTHPHASRRTVRIHSIMRAAVRVLVIVMLVVVSILFPAFDNIMAFLGSALCYTICIILPVAFYLRICGARVTLMERMACYVLISVASVLCVVGTIWSFLPKKWIMP